MNFEKENILGLIEESIQCVNIINYCEARKKQIESQIFQIDIEKENNIDEGRQIRDMTFEESLPYDNPYAPEMLLDHTAHVSINDYDESMGPKPRKHISILSLLIIGILIFILGHIELFYFIAVGIGTFSFYSDIFKNDLPLDFGSLIFVYWFANKYYRSNFYKKRFRLKNARKWAAKTNAKIDQTNLEVDKENEEIKIHNQELAKKEQLARMRFEKKAPKRAEKALQIFSKNDELTTYQKEYKGIYYKYFDKVNEIKRMLPIINIPSVKRLDIKYYTELKQIIATDQATNLGGAIKILEDRNLQKENTKKITDKIDESKDEILDRIDYAEARVLDSVNNLSEEITDLFENATTQLRNINFQLTQQKEYLQSNERKLNQVNANLNKISQQNFQLQSQNWELSEKLKAQNDHTMKISNEIRYLDGRVSDVDNILKDKYLIY